MKAARYAVVVQWGSGPSHIHLYTDDKKAAITAVHGVQEANLYTRRRNGRGAYPSAILYEAVITLEFTKPKSPAAINPGDKLEGALP